jgi:hypothetical protein
MGKLEASSKSGSDENTYEHSDRKLGPKTEYERSTSFSNRLVLYDTDRVEEDASKNHSFGTGEFNAEGMFVPNH